MKLQWFVNEKHLFDSEGDVPFVGQLIHINDNTQPNRFHKEKYKVLWVERSIFVSTKDISAVKTKSKDVEDRYYECIDIINKETEGGVVFQISSHFMKYSKDVAQINLAKL